MELLPSFGAFHLEQEPTRLLFKLTVDDNIAPAKEKKLLKTFDTGNGETTVYMLADGGYQYIIRDIYHQDCCLLITNHEFSECLCALNGNRTMRSFGLNDALMLVYAFAGAFHQTILIHASTVLCHGHGYPFIAKSGTGKSTHTALWMEHVEECELMNDDNPIIRIIDGEPYIYGSPWSGKTPCYRNIKAPLGAVTGIRQAPANSIEQLSPVQAFATLLPACSSMMWDAVIYHHLCDIVSHIVERRPVFLLNCLPDKEAALLCCKTIMNR